MFFVETNNELTCQGITDFVTSSLYFSFANWYSLGEGFLIQ
jgi:hypothetical protein